MTMLKELKQNREEKTQKLAEKFQCRKKRIKDRY